MSVALDVVADALPGYEIGRELGRGAWGVVLEGTHKQLGRSVAIKQLPPQFGADEAVRARFVAEARLLASLDHPHIVPIFDYVEHNGLCLLVMEKLPGGTVWDRFQSVGMTPESACAVIAATCAGLHFAHEKGVLHRDIKPENLIFNAAGILKVTDFGIAKVLGGGDAMATRAGEVLGTPAYMAPEQAQGMELGPQVDIYATGTMLYELLSGSLPFPEETEALALIFLHVHGQPTPLREAAPHVSQQMADVAMRAIATDPADRYATAEDFGEAIASAATATWGPGWLPRSGVQVMAAGRILAAAERPTMPVDASAAEIAAAAPTVEPASAAVVRPTRSVVKPQGVSAFEIRKDDVVSVREEIEIPPPGPLLLTSVGLLLLTVLIAFLGIGATAIGGDLGPGVVLVNGKDPVTTEKVVVDVADSVPVSVADATATRAKISFSAAGFPLASKSDDLEPAGGKVESDLDVGYGKFLIPSATTGKIEVTGGAAPGSWTFRADSGQSFFTTVPGIGGVAILLFAAAYLESLLKPLRRGRKRVAGVAGLAIVGAVGGIGILLLVWTIAGREPTRITLIGCSLAGAGAAIAAGLTAIRFGKIKRILKSQEKQEAALGQRKAA